MMAVSGITPQGSRRREQILETALDEFSRAGYGSTSMERIAERVGVTQPGLLYHFKTKQKLLTATLDYWTVRTAASLRFDSGMGIFDLLDVLVERLPRFGDDRALWRLCLHATAAATGRDHPARSWGVNRVRLVRSFFVKAIERDRDAGRVRPGVAPETVASQIAAVLDGLLIQWLLDPSEIDLAMVFADFAGLIGRDMATTTVDS